MQCTRVGTNGVSNMYRWLLHIVDTNPNSLSARGWLEDTSKVQKYVMSDAEYGARENTYRKYKEGKLKASGLSLLWAHALPVHDVSERGLRSYHMHVSKRLIDSEVVPLIASLVLIDTSWWQVMTCMHVQDDPEWTAEKELCMRKGMPYTAPRQKENVDVSPLPRCAPIRWLFTVC